MKKIFSILFWVVGISFLAWFGLSFLEVVLKNNTSNPEYFIYNLFYLIGG